MNTLGVLMDHPQAHSALIRRGADMSFDTSPGLLGVADDESREIPLTDDLAWLRDPIGKFVQGGIYLLAGQPGIGKSRLALQLALDLGVQGLPTLYVLTEESKAAIRTRALMMGSSWAEADLKQAMSLIHPEDTVYDIANLPSFLGHQVIAHSGRYHGVQLIIIDSIQGHGLSANATKQYKKLYEFCKLSKAEGVSVLLITHVTKTGAISGPKDLEHNVDCVLYMKKALICRPLFVPKNRFGPAVLQPIPLEMDRKTAILRLSPHSHSVSSVARTFLGRGAGKAEAQAAVSLPNYGTRGQIIAPGLPRKEIEQLLSCISQIPDMDIGDLSYSVQCRLPGERRYRRLLDLPLSMALIASYLHRDIPRHHLYIGELDLLRRVREIPDNIAQDLREAVETGEVQMPVRIFCPRDSAYVLSGGVKDVGLLACDRLDDAVYATWPDLCPG